MDSATFRTFLLRHFNTRAAQSLDAHVHLVAGPVTVAFHVDHGRLLWKPLDDPPDATFHFPSVERAMSILSGSEDPIAAFMTGEFFSDGYLLWTFPLLSLFRPGPEAAKAPD